MPTFVPHLLRPILSCVVIIVGLVLPGDSGRRAEAGFEVGNLDANNGYNTLSGFNLTGPQIFTGQGYAIAVRFTVNSASAVSFDSAELGLTYRSGTNALNVSLMRDAGGVPGGSALETIHLSNIVAGPNLVTLTSTVHSTLNAGISYWLVASYGAGDTNIGWLANSTRQVGDAAYRPDTVAGLGSWVGDPEATDPSFAVFGTFVGSSSAGSVDTPPSGVLLGIGFAGVVGSRLVRGRRSATR